MKTTRKFTALVSACTTILVVVAMRIGQLYGLFEPVYMLFYGLLAAVFSYLLVRWAIGRLVEHQIRAIYQNIKDTQRDTGVDYRNMDLEEARRDVEEWAEQKRKEISALKVREKYRREFIGNVSHELKTPIFNIQGYILTLLDGGLDDATINRDYLTRANKSVDRMIRLVQDLELITKLEAGVLQMDMKRLELVGLVEEVIDSIELKARKRQVQIEIEAGQRTSYWVQADAERIAQVLTNLITNAVKYSKDDGGLVKIGIREFDDNIEVRIADNGMGIPKADLPRLFERFYRVDKSRSRDFGGTGLGLSIVKHIIEAHGQSIQVKSEEGVGSVFTFTLQKS
jgi:two-component system phosphate regulon sensor histidine kinase PhoR